MNELVEYRPVALSVARDFYLPGAERKDVEQEAMIALWVAARDFDPSRGVPFAKFAALVVRRRLSSALKAATRDGPRLLSESAREARDDDDGELVPIVDLLPGGCDPADVVIERERLARLAEAIRRLSPLERDALARTVNGESYAGDKQTDNALVRARAKLRRVA